MSMRSLLVGLMVVLMALPAYAFNFTGNRIHVAPAITSVPVWEKVIAERGDFLTRHCAAFLRTNGIRTNPMNCAWTIGVVNGWFDHNTTDVEAALRRLDQLDIGEEIWVPVSTVASSALPSDAFENIDISALREALGLPALDEALRAEIDQLWQDVWSAVKILDGRLDTVENDVTTLQSDLNTVLENMLKPADVVLTGDLAEKGYLTWTSLVPWLGFALLILLVALGILYWRTRILRLDVDVHEHRLEKVETGIHLIYHLVSKGKVRLQNPPTPTQIESLKERVGLRQHVSVTFGHEVKTFIIEYVGNDEKGEALFVVHGTFGRDQSTPMLQGRIIPHLAGAISYERDLREIAAKEDASKAA